jgi:drug/metabolite transporter (DMT)-like permease
MSQRLLGFVILSLAMALLGSSFIAGKMLIAAVPVSLALTFRLIIASGTMTLVLVHQDGRLPRLDRRCWLLVCLTGFIGVVLFNLVLFQAYSHTSVASVGVVFGILPIAVALMSAVFLAERLRIPALVAILLAAFGMVQLNDRGTDVSAEQAASTLGILICLCAVLCEGAFTIFAKVVSRRLSPCATAALVSSVSLLMVAPFAAYEAQRFDFAALSVRDWLALVWWAAASGIGYFWLWFAGVARVEAHVAGVVTVVLPLSTLFLSYLILHETISPSHVLGAACGIAAVLIISLRPASELLRSLLSPQELRVRWPQ